MAIFGFWLYGLACIAISEVCLLFDGKSQVISAVITFCAAVWGLYDAVHYRADFIFGESSTRILGCYDLLSPLEDLMSGSFFPYRGGLLSQFDRSLPVSDDSGHPETAVDSQQEKDQSLRLQRGNRGGRNGDRRGAQRGNGDVAGDLDFLRCDGSEAVLYHGRYERVPDSLDQDVTIYVHVGEG